MNIFTGFSGGLLAGMGIYHCYHYFINRNNFGTSFFSVKDENYAKAYYEFRTKTVPKIHQLISGEVTDSHSIRSVLQEMRSSLIFSNHYRPEYDNVWNATQGKIARDLKHSEVLVVEFNQVKKGCSPACEKVHNIKNLLESLDRKLKD